MITTLKDKIQGKVPSGQARSSHWPTVRKHFLEKNSACAVCGSTDKLEVHHKMPFHLNPALELDETNLITLCESNKNGINCHLLVGHLGNYKSFNKSVEQDAQFWKERIENRPDPSKQEGDPE